MFSRHLFIREIVNIFRNIVIFGELTSISNLITANIDRCRAARRDCDSINKELDRLLPTKSSILKSATTGNSRNSKTREELDEIDTMWTRISSIVKKRQSDLALAETQTEKFWSKQSQIHSQLDQLDDELRSLKESHEGYDPLVEFESKQNQVN